MHSAPTDPTAQIDELSLVMPALNEESCILEVVERSREALAARCRRFEIVVVDDGSTDRTASLLADLSSRAPWLRVVTHERNRGYAAALRSGFAAATFDPVLYTDADGQFDLADLDRAMPLFYAGADLVAGYRAPRVDPWLRKFASFVFNRIARAVTGLRERDIDCAFKIFRRSFLDRLKLTSGGFMIDTEFYARARLMGARVVQLPVRHLPRLAGESTVRPSAVWRSLRELFALRRSLSEEAAYVRPRWQTVALALAPVLLAAGLAAVGQGARALGEPDEGRYVEAALEMVESGNWAVPRLHGLAYLDKPPVTYWLIAQSLRWFGPSELAARLPLVVAHAGTAAAVVWLAWTIWGAGAGFAAGLAFALALGPFLGAAVLTPDAILGAFVAWTAALVFVAERSGRSTLWILAGAAAGLALMTKGAALLVFAAPLALGLTLARRGLGWLRRAGPWIAALTALAVAAPWHSWVWSHLEGSFDYMVGNQVTGRLADESYNRNPQWHKAFTLYLPVLLAGFLPWTLLAYGWLRRLGPALRRWRETPPAALYLGAWIAVPIVVFAVAKSRQPLYLLPVFTPLAIVAGRQIERTWSHRTGRWRLAFVSLLVCWVVSLGLLKILGPRRAEWHADRDGRQLSAAIRTAVASPGTAIFAVDSTLHSLRLYGLPDVRWVTLNPEPYPMYTLVPQLAAALAEESPADLLLVARSSKRGALLEIATGFGYDCADRGRIDRLLLLGCRRDGEPRSPAPATPAGAIAGPLAGPGRRGASVAGVVASGSGAFVAP